MELHPEKITPYTVKDDKAKTNNNPKSKSTKTARVEKGITAQLHKLKNKVKYDSGLKRGNTGVRDSLVARAIKEFKEESGKEEPVEEEQAMVEEPKGLMARRKA